MDDDLTFETESGGHAMIEDFDDDDGFESVENDFIDSDEASRKSRSALKFRGKGFKPKTSTFVGQGIQNATLNTPRGNATLKLPEAATPLTVFQRHAAETKKNFTQVSSDIAVARKAIEVESKARVADVNRLTAQITRLKKDSKSHSSMATMMPLLLMQQIDRRVSSLHPGSGSNPMMSMLPMMLMMQGNGGGSDSMNMMMMMMMSGAFNHQPQPQHVGTAIVV
jgi:hypothetical protein